MEEKKTRLEDKELDSVSGGDSACTADWRDGIDMDACVGCGFCAENCPMQCISIRNLTAHIDTGSCIHCNYCMGFCPTGAIDPDRL